MSEQDIQQRPIIAFGVNNIGCDQRGATFQTIVPSMGSATVQERNVPLDGETIHSDDSDNDVDLFNHIFLFRGFDSTERLKRLRDVIACAIDLGNGEEGKNEHTLNLAKKSEWYYLMEALIEAKVVRSTLTVPDLYRQMKEWFPEIAALKGDVTEEKFISNLTGSVSAERRKWKEMATENVIPLKEMVVKNQASSRMKQERALDLYKAAYTGLCVKLQTLKAEIEKEKAKH